MITVGWWIEPAPQALTAQFASFGGQHVALLKRRNPKEACDHSPCGNVGQEEKVTKSFFRTPLVGTNLSDYRLGGPPPPPPGPSPSARDSPRWNWKPDRASGLIASNRPRPPGPALPPNPPGP